MADPELERRLDRLVQRLREAGGDNLLGVGPLAPLPFTREAVDVVAANVAELRRA